MRKIIAVGLLSFSLLLGWVQIRTLIAEAYRQRSQEIADRNPASDAALQAANGSIRLAPWRSDARAELSWRLQSSGYPVEARRQFAAALSAAPADAYLWAEYAQLLARQRKFGHEMEYVTNRSNRLGPTSRAIQQSNADTGLYFWTWGSRTLQQEWLYSMEFMLRSDRNLFLQRVRDSGRTQFFCFGPATQLPLADWCAAVEFPK